MRANDEEWDGVFSKTFPHRSYEDYLVEVLKRLPHNATPEQAAGLTPARIAAERKAKAEAVARAEAEQVA